MNNVSEKIIIPGTSATTVIINAKADIDQKESNSNVSLQTLIENLDLEKPNLDPRFKNASETINTNVNNCFTNELVTPQFITTNEEQRQVFETIATTEKINVVETIDTPKTMSLSQSISNPEEAKASPQLLAIPDQLAATIARKINYDSQVIPNSKNPGTTSEQIKEVVIDQILNPVENVNVPSVKPVTSEELIKEHEVTFSNPINTSQLQSSNTNANSGSTNISHLKQAIFEKLNKDQEPEVSSSNICVTLQPQSSNTDTNNCINNGSITEVTTTARSLPALPPLTSNTKKMQPVAKIKPMPTNNPSGQDKTDDDDEIEVLEEIIDLDKYRSKSYTEAFVTPDGCIIDLHSQVIGHLDPEKTKHISFKPGEPLITLRQDEIKYVSKAGCSKTKIPLSKDDTEKLSEGSCTSKKIFKPIEEQVPCEEKRTENKDECKPRKKSIKKKPKILVVEKRSLPVRSKKRTEEGFYKKFAEDAEEDISNASDNDYDDPSYEPEEVEFFPIDNSNSNEMNGTDPNSGEDHEMKNSEAPSTSGEIISKEGTTENKEPESSNKKIIRAMPLSVRLKKEEEKRKRIERESKVQNNNTPSSTDNSNETDSNSIQTNEMDPKLKEMDNSDEASRINQEKIIKEAESSNEKNKRAMPLSVRLKKKGGEEWKCVESESNIEIEKVTKATASINDNSNSSSYLAPISNKTNGTDSNSIEGDKIDPKHKEIENSADIGSINEKNNPSTTGEIISKDATTNTEKQELSNKRNKRAIPLSIRLKKKGEEKRRRVESESKAQNKTNGTDASTIIQAKENIVKNGSTDTKEAESSNKKNKRAMPLSVRLKKNEEKRRRVESESIREIEEEPALLVPKVEICDYSSPIPKIKEASSSSIKIKQEQIDSAPKTSAILIKKEIITEDSFEQVDNIQSQSVPASELTTSTKILPTSSAISVSPICVENLVPTNNQLINSVVSYEALPMSPEKVPEQIEETEFALMISNVTSLALPDEDLVGFSPAVNETYSMVKATRADLMKNLVAHESIFKISTRDSLKLFQHAFNKVFKIPN